MVDNFEPIKKLLHFPDKDNFYFVQILQRKKDHKGIALGGSNNNSRVIKTYYIRSIEHLDIHREEMIKLANLFNARVSINLNPRSFEKAGFAVMEKIARQMGNKDYYSIRMAYDSVCGEYHSEMDKRWLVDIDTQDTDEIMKVKNAVEFLHSKIENRDYKILTMLPSRAGVHIICNPFNRKEFTEMCPGVEIHCNNPTNVWIP